MIGIIITIINYSYIVFNWALYELTKLDRKTRKIMTEFRINIPKSDIERFYSKTWRC